MAFDPCGTRKLEGEEILKRLADYLYVEPDDLRSALKLLLKQAEIDPTHKNTP